MRRLDLNEFQSMDRMSRVSLWGGTVPPDVLLVESRYRTGDSHGTRRMVRPLHRSKIIIPPLSTGVNLIILLPESLHPHYRSTYSQLEDPTLLLVHQPSKIPLASQQIAYCLGTN